MRINRPKRSSKIFKKVFSGLSDPRRVGFENLPCHWPSPEMAIADQTQRSCVEIFASPQITKDIDNLMRIPEKSTWGGSARKPLRI